MLDILYRGGGSDLVAHPDSLFRRDCEGLCTVLSTLDPRCAGALALGLAYKSCGGNATERLLLLTETEISLQPITLAKSRRRLHLLLRRRLQLLPPRPPYQLVAPLDHQAVHHQVRAAQADVQAQRRVRQPYRLGERGPLLGVLKVG